MTFSSCITIALEFWRTLRKHPKTQYLHWNTKQNHYERMFSHQSHIIKVLQGATSKLSKGKNTKKSNRKSAHIKAHFNFLVTSLFYELFCVWRRLRSLARNIPALKISIAYINKTLDARFFVLFDAEFSQTSDVTQANQLDKIIDSISRSASSNISVTKYFYVTIAFHFVTFG